MNGLDRARVAERLRGLIAGQDNGDLAETAARLGLEEVSLRMSIDPDSPHPTVEVLAAVIRVYGVDPTWLLTGEYNGLTHRTAMESTDATVAAVRAFMTRRSGPISEPTSENIHLRELN